LAIDIEEIVRTLNEIMPYLAKQKMELDQQRKSMQMYLEREMEIMRGRAGYREEEQFRGRDIGRELEAFSTFLKTGAEGVKGLDQPLLQLLERLATAGIAGKEIPTVEPEKVGAALAPYTETMAEQAGALERGEYLPAEKMGIATQLLGSKRAMDLLKEIGKTRAGREAREVTREKTRLGWAELGVKKKGETKKQLEDKLKFFAKKEKVFSDELKSLEDLSGLMEGDPEYDTKKTQIAEMRQNQVNVLDQLLGELDKKKADKIISELRANKITATGMEKYKEQFKKEYKLTEAEYNYIRLNL